MRGVSADPFERASAVPRGLEVFVELRRVGREQRATQRQWLAVDVAASVFTRDFLDKLGANLDAAADKLAQVACLAFFLGDHEPTFARVPLAFFGLILGRDIVLLTGYLILRRRAG